MGNQYTTNRVGRAVRQAGIRNLREEFAGRRANGLMLRGCVIRTYVTDDTNDEINLVVGEGRSGVFCDVLCYSSMVDRNRNVFLQYVPVTQARAGMHGGDLWLPRAAQIDVESPNWDSTAGTSIGTNIARLDGDHVLIGFIDDDLNQPIILRAIPHPYADRGVPETKDLGIRQRLRQVDGAPRLDTHKGVAFGVDGSGNFVVDTREAFAPDAYAQDGTPPAPAEDGSAGNVVVKLQEGSTVTVEIGNGIALELTQADGDTTMTIGDGARKVAIADFLETLYTQLVTWLQTHTHPTGVGPSNVPIQAAAVPPWDPQINSAKVTIPEN